MAGFSDDTDGSFDFEEEFENDSSNQDSYHNDEPLEGEVIVSEDTNGVVKIAGKSYAVELQWDAPEDVNDTAKYARKAANSESMQANLFCVRGENDLEYGLGWKSKGHKLGMPSLAAHLTQSSDDNWVGAFKLANHFYVLAYKDGRILSDTDKIYKDEEEAKDEFNDKFYQFDWDISYAPNDWELDGPINTDISSLLIGKSNVRLKEVSQAKVLIKFGLIVALLGGLIFGIIQLLSFVDARSNIEKVTAVYNEVETRIIRETRPEEVKEYIPPPPWEGEDVGIARLSSCVNDINKMDINIPGWEAKGMICGDTVTSMLLERSGGTINWIGFYLNGKGIIDPNIIRIDDDRVEAVYPSSIVSEYPEQLETFPVQQVQRYLYSHFDEAYLDVEFGSDVTFSDPESFRFYIGQTFEFVSKYEPNQFTKIISKVPGFVINSIEYKISENTWTVKGEYYQKRINPLPPEEN